MNTRSYSINRARKIAKLAYAWCETTFGHPLKTASAEFKLSNDKRVSNLTGYYLDREIVIYVQNIDSYADVIRTVIHEYTHYLQMPKMTDNAKYCRMDSMYGYDNNPFELEAVKNENKYYDSCRKFVYGKLSKRKK